jgi:2'-5' RNA ligase
MKRLFFAISLPDEVREAATRIQAQLRMAMGDRGIGWEAPAKFHYTLKFLGDSTEEEQILAIDAARSVVPQISPFSLTVAEVGVFPRQRRPKILWLGVGGDFPLLIRLAECLDRELFRKGFAPETRPFHPHITLARIKTEEGQEAVAKTLKTETESLEEVDRIGVFEVYSFVLIQSELRPSGSVYTVLETFSLTTL